jgi:hypothetical protein
MLAEDTDPFRRAEGYDQPTENDLLGRLPIIERIYDALISVPSDWSVRVALYAPYGEGKTSVCKVVAAMAERDGHGVMFFNPWADTDARAMMTRFGSSLHDLSARRRQTIKTAEAARGESINAQGWTGRPENVGWKERGRRFMHSYKDPIRSAAGSDKVIGGLTGAVVSIAERTLEITPETITELRGVFSGKRIIVMIDDLDRAKPELMVHLLMTVREILDLRGFSFLLPFDTDIVGDALRTHLGTNHDPLRFLEKIVDIPFFLEPSDPDAIADMFRTLAREHLPFVPSSALDKVVRHLPSNPRRLKAVIRRMIPLKAAAARHALGELDWITLLYASLVGAESQVFLKAFMALATRDPLARAVAEMNLARKREGQQKPDDVERMLEEAAGKDSQLRERLANLATAWKEHLDTAAAGDLRYQVSVLQGTLSYTSGNVVDAIEAARVGCLDRWITESAIERHETEAGIAHGLALATLQAYSGILERMLRQVLYVDQRAMFDQARQYLFLIRSLTRRLVTDGPSVGNDPGLFGMLASTAKYWRKVRVGGTQRLRVLEQSLLVSWLKRVMAADVDTALITIADFNNLALVQESPVARRLIDLAREAIVADLRRRASTPNGFGSLKEFGFSFLEDVLLDPAGLGWTGTLQDILSKAAVDHEVQRNALKLFEAVVDTASPVGHIGITATALVDDAQKLLAIWNAATATQLGFYTAALLKKERERLLVYRPTAEVSMPVPVWML